jgi:hypothetical protein
MPITVLPPANSSLALIFTNFIKGSIRPERLEINLQKKLILPMSCWSSLFVVGGTIVLTAS